MKTVMTFFPGLLFALGLWTAPSVLGGIDIDVHVNREPTRDVNVVEGQDFTIVLPVTQQQQGYIWELEKSPGDNVTLLSTDRCQPEAKGPCVEERWHFRAIDEGKETLRFRYARPGDPDHPIDRIAYKIKVHD